MNRQQTLDTHFPGAISESDFISRSYAALQVHGFHRENAIACVGVCRDEVTSPFVGRIQAVWGEAFNFSSLGGMLFLGETGFRAAHHHAPVVGGRERYVHFALAHIAIDGDGAIGTCHRPGRAEPSGACGALLAIRRELCDGKLNLDLAPQDIELSLLKHRLFRKIRYGEVPDLVELTKMAHQVIVDDLVKMVGATVDPSLADSAILTGIQIHGHTQEEMIWPGTMQVVVNGHVQSLTILPHS